MLLLICAMFLILAHEKKWKIGYPNGGIPLPPTENVLILFNPSLTCLWLLMAHLRVFIIYGVWLALNAFFKSIWLFRTLIKPFSNTSKLLPLWFKLLTDLFKIAFSNFLQAMLYISLKKIFLSFFFIIVILCLDKQWKSKSRVLIMQHSKYSNFQIRQDNRDTWMKYTKVNTKIRQTF